METIAPVYLNVSPTKLNKEFLHKSYHHTNGVQIQLPLHKPNYKSPIPIKVKTPPRNSDPKPNATTSDILRLMDSLKLDIPLDIYTSLIKECTFLREPEKAIVLHTHIRRSGIRFSLTLLNRVLLMYVSCGCFVHARQLFDQMPLRDFNSWAVVIAGSVENGEYSEALDLFTTMLREVRFENASVQQLEFSVSGILVFALKSCLHTMDLELGRQVHGWLWKMGYSRNVVLSSTLISFYGRLERMGDAKSVFEQADDRNTVVWTASIVNCCSQGNFEEAVAVFSKMGREGVRRNGYTFANVLKASGRMKDKWCGRQVHASVMKLGLESDAFVQSALVDMYGKCGLVEDATRMFDISRERSSGACYNALLANYAHHGLCTETSEIICEMKLAGFEPNELLFSEINLFCGSRI